jgi:zinc finger CCHC domain-containing protein 8
MDIIKRFYKKKLEEELNIIDDPANNRIIVTEKLVKKDDDFLIDTTPTVDACTQESTPRYTSLSKSALTFVRLHADKDGQKSTPSARASCFNCGKCTHSLRDCPEPRNLSKIRKARNEFNRKELRYLDDENEFSKFSPGQLSEDLKEALGIRSNEIPLHVYRMRSMGYPPAWLEEAKVYNSGLSLFIEKDKVQSHDEEHRPFKFDVQKIHDFPGFNVPPEPPFVDKHRLLNYPPMQEQHSKEFFIKSMMLGDAVINGYKKRKLKDIGVHKDTTAQHHVEADMEIEDSDDDDVCIVTQPPGTEMDKPPSPDEDGEILDESPASPSVDELQTERNQLLAELNSPFVENQSKTSTVQLIEKTILEENSVNENLDNSSKDIQVGHVETTIYGATVLPAFSPFDNLPAGENFKEGVCDVIAFENLAESTGKYETMKGLIRKVRVVLKDHHKDE